MATINGQLVICERCGTQIFRKVTGEGEADGGYTRWNNFEPFPSGWRNVEVPPDPNRKYNCMLVCPECSALWDSLITEHFLNTIKEVDK